MKEFIKYLYCVAFAALVSTSCNNENKKGNDRDGDDHASKVANISYSIVNIFPHDTSSFTQGLVVYNGVMYEGTGGSDYSPEGGNSHLYEIDIKTGKQQKSVKLPGQYFGEGVTVLNDTVYQLTWREKKVFVYTLPDLKKVNELPLNTEGWGLTHNGTELIVSDGTSNLYFYEPSTFKLLRTQGVTYGGQYLDSINELEYIEGFVYANRWQHAEIYKIDPGTGIVTAIVDLTQIWNRIKNIDPAADVPNGIAYDADTKKIYITGKKWPELYEIELGQ